MLHTPILPCPLGRTKTGESSGGVLENSHLGRRGWLARVGSSKRHTLVGWARNWKARKGSSSSSKGKKGEWKKVGPHQTSYSSSPLITPFPRPPLPRTPPSVPLHAHITHSPPPLAFPSPSQDENTRFSALKKKIYGPTDGRTLLYRCKNTTTKEKNHTDSQKERHRISWSVYRLTDQHTKGKSFCRNF